MNTKKAITTTTEVEVVSVSALPDEVELTITATDGVLTPGQARELAVLLLDAAEESADLDWVERDGDLVIVQKETQR